MELLTSYPVHQPPKQGSIQGLLTSFANLAGLVQHALTLLFIMLCLLFELLQKVFQFLSLPPLFSRLFFRLLHSSGNLHK